MRINQHCPRLSNIYPIYSSLRIYIRDQGTRRQLDLRCSIATMSAAYLGFLPARTLSSRYHFGAFCGLISVRDRTSHLAGRPVVETLVG